MRAVGLCARMSIRARRLTKYMTSGRQFGSTAERTIWLKSRSDFLNWSIL